jgi:PAS domain S-box-containing protein
MQGSFPDLVYRTLQDARDHALLVLDTDGVIRWMSLGATELFRCPPEQLLGAPFAQIFVPEDIAAGMPQQELEVARSRGRSEDDRWHLRADGSRFWASGALYAVRDPDGTLRSFGKILRDRTELKAQLEAYRQQVEHLKQVEQERDQALAVLAHELRSPLGAVSGTTQLLRRAPDLPQPVQPQLERLERQTTTLRRMVEQLLEGLGARMGKLSLERKPLDLSQTVMHAADEVRQSIMEHGHQFELLLPLAPIWVEGDELRLQQVFVNLLANAAKYTPPGGRIWMYATVEGDEAVVRVADNGAGIPPQMLSRIFEMFTQVDAEKSEGGLGIGLALVHQLVTLHGGTVQGSSPGVGEGSTFVVRLPLAQLTAGPQRPGLEGG